MTLSLLIQNFKSYDWVIFAAFAVNMVLFFRARRSADELYSLLHGMANDEPELEEIRDGQLAKMYGLRGRTSRAYALFANMTAIFPLLGILGTVIALLSMTGDLAAMETNFLAALTSTFWGLIASIIFKFLDSFISYKAESNEIYLSNFEATGKRYTIVESYAPDRASHEAKKYHN